MNRSEEQRILSGARQFDTDILAEIYDRYSPGLFSYAMRLLGDMQVSEDCVADTFSKFLTALGKKAGPRDYLQAYLYRIAHNWITDYYRRAGPQETELDEQTILDELNIPVMVESKLKMDQVRAAILRLAPEQRQVITLRFLQEWDYPEIASTLKRSIGAVKALQHRGLEKLEKMLFMMN